MKILVPKSFTSRTAYRIWLELPKILDLNFVTIDLTKLRYIDVEGTNYIALLPLILRNKAINTQILLPPQYVNIYKYLRDCGVFDMLKSDFSLHDQYELFDNNFSFNKKYISKNKKYTPHFKSIKFNSSSQEKMFDKFSENYHIFKRNVLLSERATKCLTELVFNIYDHANNDYGCISMQFKNVGKEKIPYFFICVSDLGKGIKNSFLGSPNFSKSIHKRKGDNYYIAAALTQGITSKQKGHRGLGLPIVLKNSNKVIITTGCCRASFTKDDSDLKRIKEYKVSRIKRIVGTSIAILIKGHEIN